MFTYIFVEKPFPTFYTFSPVRMDSPKYLSILSQHRNPPLYICEDLQFIETELYLRTTLFYILFGIITCHNSKYVPLVIAKALSMRQSSSTSRHESCLFMPNQMPKKLFWIIYALFTESPVDTFQKMGILHDI